MTEEVKGDGNQGTIMKIMDRQEPPGEKRVHKVIMISLEGDAEEKASLCDLHK